MISKVLGQGVSTMAPDRGPTIHGGGAPELTLRDGLISYWKMDEGATGTALDAFGGNPLTDVNGNISFTLGGIINACRGNYSTAGGTSCLRHANSADFQIGSGASFTFTAWTYRTSLSGGSFISKWDGGTHNEYILLLVDRGGGVSSFQLDAINLAGAQKVIDSITGATVASWWFVAFGYDDANQQIFLVDGGDGAHIHARQTASCVGVKSDTAVFEIGNAGFVSPYFGFSDEVGFWKRALSDAEIDRVYNAGAGLPLASF